MSEPYSYTARTSDPQPADPQLDPLDDPDLRQEDTSIDAGPDDGDELGALRTDTLLHDADDDTYDTGRQVSHATEELMSDDVDPDNETIDERVTQEEPDEAGGGGHLGLGDHVAAADAEDPERL
ncbi:hypothetical protein [Kineococcus esterisolvens]|uniref:hypothetical protein n=1 Tax=unclassified Kineococcus TaxID=2621656 RepID=UPI003D7E73BF